MGLSLRRIGSDALFDSFLGLLDIKLGQYTTQGHVVGLLTVRRR